MDINNGDFNELKKMFQKEFDKAPMAVPELFLAFVNAQQMIIIGNKLTDISTSLKLIEDKIKR